MNTKYIKEFEILEGIPYDKSDEKASAKFERYVERQEEERKEYYNDKDNWELERSSGYAGYRNVMTGDWIYESVYLELFAKKENKTDLDYNTGYYDGIKVGIQWQKDRIETLEKELQSFRTKELRSKEMLAEAFNAGFNCPIAGATFEEWFNKIKK